MTPTIVRAWLLLPALLAGCSGGSDARRDQLTEARATWKTAKPGCSTCSYVDVFRSVFGSYRKVYIEVTSDAVTHARLETGTRMGTSDVPGATTDLTPDEIAQRSNTVEELQAECAAILAHDPATNMIELAISNLGVPTTCTYRPTLCADDCTQGIMLEGFVCGPLDAGGRDGGVD